MSPAGAGSVGTDDDHNLEHGHTVTTELSHDDGHLVDGDDGHGDGGDDQHGHHPGLVTGGQGPPALHGTQVTSLLTSVNSVNRTEFVSYAGRESPSISFWFSNRGGLGENPHWHSHTGLVWSYLYYLIGGKITTHFKLVENQDQSNLIGKRENLEIVLKDTHPSLSLYSVGWKNVLLQQFELIESSAL